MVDDVSEGEEGQMVVDDDHEGSADGEVGIVDRGVDLRPERPVEGDPAQLISRPGERVLGRICVAVFQPGLNRLDHNLLGSKSPRCGHRCDTAGHLVRELDGHGHQRKVYGGLASL